VVREDRSVFPFSARARLAREATAHLPNVLVLDSSRYAVSAGTFPSYFLRRCDDLAREQMQIDVRLFGQHLAPAFSVDTRFVGHEPYSPMTAAYNLVLAEILPEYGIHLQEVPRRRLDDAGAGGEFISATRVRSAFAEGAFDRLSRLVPRPTLDYLRSPEGEAIRRRLLEETAPAPVRPGRTAGNEEQTGDRDGNP
jgi:[citrate (pro-3S)-lyase] ligase